MKTNLRSPPNCVVLMSSMTLALAALTGPASFALRTCAQAPAKVATSPQINHTTAVTDAEAANLGSNVSTRAALGRAA